MKRSYALALAAAALLTVGTAQQASAAPIDLMIGDNDGFGYGALAVPDGSPLLDNLEADDRRSASEKAAANGAQQTDLYSALTDYTSDGLPLALPDAFDVIFPFVGQLTSATFSLDMGGFETSLWGALGVSFNGIAQPGLFNFNDGQFGTAVRSFVLGADAIAAANAAQQFVVNISRGSSVDGVAFDYFRLTGDAVQNDPVPEPTTLLLLGSGAATMLLRRRRRA